MKLRGSERKVRRGMSRERGQILEVKEQIAMQEEEEERERLYKIVV